MKFILKKNVITNYFLIVFIFIFPYIVNAGTLFITPQSNNVRVGDTFYVLVNTDTKGISINAASVDIKYDPAFLSAQSVGYSNSIFSLWVEEPAYSNTTGIVHLSGGLSSPGWNGPNGAIIRVTFKAKASGQTKISLENGSVLANDGLGTNVLTSAFGSNISISEATPVIIEKVIIDNDISSSTSSTTTNQISDTFLIPIINNLPDKLLEGDKLEFGGNGVFSGQVLVYIQKGKNNPEITQVNTDEYGGFDVVYNRPVLSGYYKIWARNILADNMMSDLSEISYVEVMSNNYTYIFGNKFNTNILLVSLIGALLLFIILLIIYFAFYIKLKFKKKKQKETKGKNIINK